MPRRICFIALNALPAIDPGVAGGIGGIETRSWMFARGLAQREAFAVSFLVRHWRPLRRQEYDGVRLHLLRDRLYRARESLTLRLQRSGHFPWFHLREPRLSDAVLLPMLAARRLLVRRPDPLLPSPFFKTLPADAFVTFGVQSHSATVIASAHAQGKPAVLFLGSDGDLDERYLGDASFVSPYRDSASVCLWTIQNADAIFCQTPRQRDLLLSRFGRDGIVIRNPIDLTEWDRRQAEPVAEELIRGLDRYALWIGRAEGVHKRPLLLLEVARRCPGVSFLMVLNPRDDVLEAEVRRTAPPNVRIVPRVPFSAMPGIMRRAGVLVNTSSLEGFPNTYLQAAASGVPIASLNVEEDFLRQSHAGRFAGGHVEKLAEDVNAYWTHGQSANDAAAARRFVESRYALTKQIDALEQALGDLMTAHESQSANEGE